MKSQKVIPSNLPSNFKMRGYENPQFKFRVGTLMLQQDLDRLSVWESRWDMEFNPSKCRVVQVTTSRKASNSSYILHGHVLEVVSCVGYLGVDISNGLSWNSHIDRITSKANSTVGFIKRNIKTKNFKSQRDCLQHTCTPSAGLCCPHLGPSYKTKKISSLKKSKAELPGGPPVITITVQVGQQCFKA